MVSLMDLKITDKLKTKCSVLVISRMTSQKVEYFLGKHFAFVQGSNIMCRHFPVINVSR